MTKLLKFIYSFMQKNSSLSLINFMLLWLPFSVVIFYLFALIEPDFQSKLFSVGFFLVWLLWMSLVWISLIYQVVLISKVSKYKIPLLLAAFMLAAYLLFITRNMYFFFMFYEISSVEFNLAEITAYFIEIHTGLKLN